MRNILIGKAGSAFSLKSIKVTHHINRLKKKTHVIILIDIVKKVLDEIQHPFMMKTTQTRKRGDFLNMAKNIYNQSVANIKRNGEEIENILLRLEARQ